MPKPSLFCLITGLTFALLAGCNTDKPKDHNNTSSDFPILGPMEIMESEDGRSDTVFRELPEIALEDQYGVAFHHDSLKGQIRVVDFFFASCPGICIDMSRNLAKLYSQAQKSASRIPSDGPPPIGLRFVSYTIDPHRDTREVLAEYAERHGVKPSSRQWLLLRGKEEEIHRLAEQYYLLSAGADRSAPGGFLHSGQFLLIDPKGRIRGLYDGTQWADCEILQRDIALLQEEFRNR